MREAIEVVNGSLPLAELTPAVRAQLAFSSTTPATDTVVFDSAVFATQQQITLGGTALPQINSNLTITGPGANLLAISGANQSRVFAIGSCAIGEHLRLDDRGRQFR